MMGNDILDVTAVRHVRDHVLWLRFSDGAEGTVDMRSLISGKTPTPSCSRR